MFQSAQYLASPVTKYIDIVSFLSEFLIWLEYNDYIVSSDTAQNIFRLSNCFGVNFANMDDFTKIVKTVVCKSTEDLERFPSVMNDFIKAKREKNAELDQCQQKIQQSKKELKRLHFQKEQSCLQQQQASKDIEKIQSELSKYQDYFCSESVSVDTSLKNELLDYLKDVPLEAKKLLQETMTDKKITFSYHPEMRDITCAKNVLKDLLKEVMNSKHPMEMMRFVGDLYQKVKELDKFEKNRKENNINKLSDVAKKAEEIKKRQKDLDIEIEKELQNIQHEEQEMLIKKEASFMNRLEFLGGNRCVQTNAALGKAGEKQFKKLSHDEKKIIYAYIKRNSNKLKTKLSRKMRTSQKKDFDMQNTMKMACSSMGIPMRLCYQTKHPSKPKLIMFLDISGSCKNASELMLVFMHYMRHVFVGGCKTYVFTNRLYDISSYIDKDDPEKTVAAVLKKIKTKGIYSDYYTPLKEFYENHMNELTKDTIMLFIGDARNNKNKTGEIYIKEITHRIKKAYWLSTDEKNKWGTGDSILPLYSKYMKDTLEITNASALLDFIENQM